MPKKNAKAQKSNELDGAEFFAAINLIEKEKGIPKAYMLEKITQALVSAYKRDHEGAGDNVTVEADEEAGTVRMFVKKDVVEEVDNPCTEMSLQMAREKLPHAQLGDVIRIEVRTRDFGRIAAQTARQVIDLRVAHPELTLAQLAELCEPPVSKSAFNHRLRKLMEMARA